jgi:hypothetical protein
MTNEWGRTWRHAFLTRTLPTISGETVVIHETLFGTVSLQAEIRTVGIRSMAASSVSEVVCCLHTRSCHYRRFSTLSLVLILLFFFFPVGPPLWSSCQSCWLQIHRSRVRFLALPDFLRSSRSGTESTQPREYSWGAAWKNNGTGLESPRPYSRIAGLVIREYGRGDSWRWPHDTLYIHKSWH